MLNGAQKRQADEAVRLLEEAIRAGAEATEGMESEALEFSNANTRWSIRTEDPPEKTGTAYKVFFAKDGELYPPMVANPGGKGTPVGVWLNADVGQQAPPSKSGRPQVKAGGKGTQGTSGSLAFRPGWHLGDIPQATQFARMNPKTGKKELFPSNFVWAECEYAADIDYQKEAMSYGYTENGKFRHSYAGLPKLPENGYYRYRTNPKPDTVPWIITGAMKVNRILTDAETDAICRENGVEPMARQGGPMTAERMRKELGVEAGPTKSRYSVDADGGSVYNKTKEANKQFQKNFSGEIFTDEFLDISNREIERIRSALKTGYGNVSPDGKHGWVNTASYCYLFDVTDNDSAKITDVVEHNELNIHNSHRMEVYDNDTGRTQRDQRIDENAQNPQSGRGYSGDAIPDGPQGRQAGTADAVDGRASDRKRDRDLQEGIRTAQDEIESEPIERIDKVTKTPYKARRFSLSSPVEETDRAYLSAVKRGDMRTAQKMVDEAAEENGYTIKAYHGTDKFGFTKFLDDTSVDGRSFFFAADEDVAGSYMKTPGDKRQISTASQKECVRVLKQFAERHGYEFSGNSKKGYSLIANGEEIWDRDALDLVREIVNDYEELIEEELQEYENTSRLPEILKVGYGGVYSTYIKINNPLVVDADGGSWDDSLAGETVDETFDGNTDAVAYAKANGYDGVIVKNVVDSGNSIGMFETTVYITFDSSQVKSADPVTYDDNGDVIPLSERFNAKEPDIRYSLMAFPDGKRFVDVKADQRQFDGLTQSQMRALAAKIIKLRFAGKVVGLENRAFVNGRTAKEYSFPIKKLDDDSHEAKMRASTELDNLLDAGTNFRTAEDGQDGHTHPKLVGDFQYFDTIFKVGNQYYSGVVNIEPLKKGLKLKDVTQIENITQDISSSYGENPKSTFLRDASMDSIYDENEKSNPQYPLDTGDGFTVYGSVASYTDERIDRIIKEYGGSRNYAQGFVTYIHPRDFLKLTIRDETLAKWENGLDKGEFPEEFFPLDREKLRNNKQTPYLRVNTATGEVEGHEGRHRMLALAREGITTVPVVLVDYNTKYSKEPMAQMRLTSQDFGDGPVNGGYAVIVKDLLPTNQEYRDQIRETYGWGKAGIRFSFGSGLEEARLARENQLLREKVEYWKDQTRPSGTRVDRVIYGKNRPIRVDSGGKKHRAARPVLSFLSGCRTVWAPCGRTQQFPVYT